MRDTIGHMNDYDASTYGERIAGVYDTWPSELDLMGRLAGLRLRDRWAGWDRAPFTAGSGRHISVYEHAR